MTSTTKTNDKVIDILRVFLNRFENINIGWGTVLFLAVFIIAVRIVLEIVLSSITEPSPFQSFIFFESWFLALFLSLAVFISYIGRKNVLNSARILLFGLPIILIPLIGLWQGKIHSFVWPQGSWGEIFYQLVTFLLFHPLYGTYFTIEILVFLVAIFTYLLCNASLFRALLGMLGAYGILAFFALHGKIFGDIYPSSPLTNLLTTRFYTIIDFLILMTVGIVIFWQENPIKVKAFVFHFRPKRALFGGTLSVLILIGALLAPKFYFFNFFCSFILFNLLLFYAAVSNDLADIEIDKISNPTRPYASGMVTEGEMRYVKNISLIILFIFVLIVYSFPIALVTFFNVFLSILYSPLRLRKYFFAFIIPALGEGTAVFYGYFGQQPSQMSMSSDTLRFFIAFFLLLCFFLPIKDLKDKVGDFRAGVRNILTVFGWNKAKLIIAIMVFLGYSVFAFLIWGSFFAVLVSSLVSIISAYFVFNYKCFGEQPLYLIFFISVFSALLVFMI